MDRVRLLKPATAALPSYADARDRLLKFHPLAELFPLIDGEEFCALVEDIQDHGLHEPVVLFEGKILDGRNRYRACSEARVECRFETYQGADPVGYVVSLNLKRRHLSESQRAMVAAKLATLQRGDNQHSEGLPIGRSSELLNVGDRSVARAREVLDEGAPELISAVERGRVSVSAASDVACLSKDEQREIVARGSKEILEAAKRIRAERAVERRAEWIARTVELSKANAPLPRDRHYPIILADPPWAFEVYDASSGLDSAAEAHYPTISTEEICALKVADLAAPDAALFLWATSPHLPEALQVMRAWGFEYKTSIVWVKDRSGLGYWVRDQHELLLISARGDMRSPPAASRPPSVINAPRREHGRKPDEAYALIERMYPDLPKIELFARGKAREGWGAWGNEAEAAA
jgi:N6-adenosine-specific RNA methylase IME4